MRRLVGWVVGRPPASRRRAYANVLLYLEEDLGCALNRSSREHYAIGLRDLSRVSLTHRHGALGSRAATTTGAPRTIHASAACAGAATSLPAGRARLIPSAEAHVVVRPFQRTGILASTTAAGFAARLAIGVDSF